MRRALPYLAAAIASLGASCKEKDPGIAVPSVGTEFALFGTAAEGRGIAASSVVIRRSAEITTVAPEPIGGGNVDMVFAGLEGEDFPVDLPPDRIELVAPSDERARPLPKIHAAHVFEEPAPFEHPSALVPVDQPSVPKDFLADRVARLEAMLRGFAVENPCRELLAPFTVNTPRIPADAVVAMRTLSSGETFVGFSATSTAILGVFGPSDTEPEIIGVTTSTVTPVLEGEVADISDLGDTEALLDGRPVPGELVVNVQGGFGSVGSSAFWDPAKRRWVDDTPPLAEAFPRFLFGSRHVSLDGAGVICTYGAVQGSDRAAAIWCRPEAGGPWSLAGRFTRKFGVTAIDVHEGNILAFDLAGTVYEHVRQDDWSAIFTSALNAGCDPLCANFAALRIVRAPDLFGVMAGGKAQVLFLIPSGGSLQAIAPEIIPAALFSDEREDAERPKRFTAAASSPDGALWLGTETPDLFRVAPDRATVERICLPKDVSGYVISGIEPHPEGRLILGFSPSVFAFSDWRL
jgi:hypothetical protein